MKKDIIIFVKELSEALLAPNMKSAYEFVQAFGESCAKVVDLDSVYVPSKNIFMKNEHLDRTKSFFVEVDGSLNPVKANNEEWEFPEAGNEFRKVNVKLSEYIFSYGFEILKAYEEYEKNKLMTALLRPYGFSLSRKADAGVYSYFSSGESATDISFCNQYIKIPLMDTLGRLFALKYTSMYEITTPEKIEVISEDLTSFCEVSGMEVHPNAKKSLSEFAEIVDTMYSEGGENEQMD